MSVSSHASSVSVSMNGEVMLLEQAIDNVYRDVQQSLNFCHTSMRELNMMAEREEDYKTIMSESFQIHDYIDVIASLFLELKQVLKQVTGNPKTPEEKEWLVKEKETRKRLKAERKAKTAEERKANREKTKQLNEFMAQTTIS